MDIQYIAESIVKGAYIAKWFVGAGIGAIFIYQLPAVRSWFEKVSE